MSTGFAVEDDALNRLATALNEVSGAAEGAANSLKDAGAGSLGTGELDDACAKFQKEWSYGLGQLKKSVDAVRQQVVDTAKTYDQVDEAVRQALNEFRIPG